MKKLFEASKGHENTDDDEFQHDDNESIRCSSSNHGTLHVVVAWNILDLDTSYDGFLGIDTLILRETYDCTVVHALDRTLKSGDDLVSIVIRAVCQALRMSVIVSAHRSLYSSISCCANSTDSLTRRFP